MDVVLNHFGLTDYLTKLQFDVLDPVFTIYTRCFWRFLFAISLFYGLLFLQLDPIRCVVFNTKISQHFVQDMCIQGYYRAEKPFMADSQDTMVQYDYYAWIFLLILFQVLKFSKKHILNFDFAGFALIYALALSSLNGVVQTEPIGKAQTACEQRMPECL